MNPFISKIEITNFRSIENCVIDLNNITVFSGSNDAGKSNILKALNLFFNGETDYGVAFNFYDDKCHLINEEKITISLTINQKLKRKNKGREYSIFKYTKKWDKSGFLANDSGPEINAEISSALAINQGNTKWFESLRYRYIPSLKDSSYLNNLKKEIYEILAHSINSSSLTFEFIELVQNETKILSDKLNNILQIKSGFDLSNNNFLFDILESLDFQTSYTANSNNIKIPLSSRGDGIKMRHIPNILLFLHQKECSYNDVHTIWGYEEPESFLELSAAFSEAKHFHSLSSEHNIQIILTTHSPAFYNLYNEYKDNVSLVYTDKNENNSTSYKIIGNTSLMDGKLGILELVSPYIKDKLDEIKKLQDIIKDFPSAYFNKNILFLEGESDKIIFESVLKNLNQEQNFEIILDDKSRGADPTINHLMAWAMHPKTTQNNFKAFAILDSDDAGQKAIQKFKDAAHNIQRINKQQKNTKIITFKKANINILNRIKSKLSDFPIGLEEIYPIEVWKYAKQQGWLIERRNLNSIVSKKNTDNSKSVNDFINENFNDEEELYIKYQIDDGDNVNLGSRQNRKEALAHYVVENDYLSNIIDFFQSAVLSQVYRYRLIDAAI